MRFPPCVFPVPLNTFLQVNVVLFLFFVSRARRSVSVSVNEVLNAVVIKEELAKAQLVSFFDSRYLIGWCSSGFKSLHQIN